MEDSGQKKKQGGAGDKREKQLREKRKEKTGDQSKSTVDQKGEKKSKYGKWKEKNRATKWIGAGEKGKKFSMPKVGNEITTKKKT